MLRVVPLRASPGLGTESAAGSAAGSAASAGNGLASVNATASSDVLAPDAKVCRREGWEGRGGSGVGGHHLCKVTASRQLSRSSRFLCLERKLANNRHQDGGDHRRGCCKRGYPKRRSSTGAYQRRLSQRELPQRRVFKEVCEGRARILERMNLIVGLWVGKSVGQSIGRSVRGQQGFESAMPSSTSPLNVSGLITC